MQKNTSGDLLVKYSLRKVMIDGANASYIKSKIHWGERPDYENVKKET